ncbi:hypothetical protein [Dysgonomonas sp. 25]|uniref:hypothetical protein n=1 Tax=Dysgonomonas sp. 25 TaxID=2302933 RepID=UPI0013D1D4BD|nr:hypothetical protein [Dysgonomonas sp. 25]NDV68183.1 hypothetical protein [Dysgonomonas sp. 25]
MLEKFDKNANPFKVPENYFADFNKSIMEQLPSPQQEKAKKVPLWKKYVPWTAVAAALIGAVFYIGFIFDKADNGATSGSVQQTNYAATTFTEDEMVDYMEEEVIASAYNDMLYYDSMYK